MGVRRGAINGIDPGNEGSLDNHSEPHGGSDSLLRR